MPAVPRPLARVALCALLTMSAAAHAARGGEAPVSLLSNPGILLYADGDTQIHVEGEASPPLPAGEGFAFVKEETGNHVLRLTSQGPEKTSSLRRETPIPAGASALELTWRWRAKDLKARRVGQDARLRIQFLDTNGQALSSVTEGVNTRVANHKEWANKRVAFSVPADARTVVIEPSLIEVASGQIDFDDIVLRTTDPAPVLAIERDRAEIAKARHVPAEVEKRDHWPLELRVEGPRLLDSSGKELWLQGLNAGGLEMEPLDPQPIKSLVVGIEEWNAKIIRLPVQDRFWYGEDPRQTDDGAAYREFIDRCVTLSANRGVYLIIDLHEFRAPKPRHLKFWKDIAAHYANHPAVIFELLNEPFDTSWEVWRDGGFVAEKNKAVVDESAFLSEEDKKKNQGFEAVGMQPLLDAIRATGAKNVVIVGGLHWSFDLRGITEGFEIKDPTGHGIVYSWHVYNWHKDWEKHLLAAAAKHPILVGEVGADTKKMNFIPLDAQEDPYTWVPDMLGFIQKHRLHWTGWCFHPHHTPVMISDWKYTPTPFWGVFAKDALAGKQFDLKRVR